MPVKVRCPKCQKVLAAPDRARGKAVKCPGCATAIRVPSAAAKKGAARPDSAASEDDLASLDLRQIEDDRARICPKCAADLSWLDDDETECPQCGYDPTVGGLGRRARQKRSGPNPDEFWADAWTGSWSFLQENWSLALKMGGYWTASAVIALSFLNIAAWCERTPPMIVWGAIGVIFTLGLPGLYWSINNQIIEWTLDSRRKLEIHFDFFQNMTLGLKAIAWPWILFLPLTAPAIGAAAVFGGIYVDWSLFMQVKYYGVVGVTPPEFTWHPMAPQAFQAAAIAVAAAYALSRPLFPVGQVHMTARYTYKAWLPVDLLIVFFKNIGPSLYWCAMWLALFVPVVAPIALVAAVWPLQFEAFVTGLTGKLATLLGSLIDSPIQVQTEGERPLFTVVSAGEIGVMFTLLVGFSWVVVFTLLALPLAMLTAFPAVFMIRANGLLGYYFKEPLDLVQDRFADVPAGFWVRYLAFLVDALILLVVLLLFRLVLYFMAFMAIIFGGNPDSVLPYLLMYAYGALSFLFAMFYFAKQESDPAQSTMGKHGVGLIVTDLNGRRITQGTAFARFFISLLAFIAFPMAAFTEKKQALQDMLTKTLVVWKGDEASS